MINFHFVPLSLIQRIVEEDYPGMFYELITITPFRAYTKLYVVDEDFNINMTIKG